jgi:predicted Na+-dependent transporter
MKAILERKYTIIFTILLIIGIAFASNWPDVNNYQWFELFYVILEIIFLSLGLFLTFVTLKLKWKNDKGGINRMKIFLLLLFIPYTFSGFGE